MYDVYWFALDDDGIKIPGIQYRIRIEYFSGESWELKNEIQKNNRMNNEHKSNKDE